MDSENKSEKKTCAHCGAGFECGAQTGSCWCRSLPSLPQVKSGLDCLCPQCLQKEIEKQKGNIPQP